MMTITQVAPADNYTLQLVFSNGQRQSVCIAHLLYGEMFEPLKDVGLFNQVGVDEFGAVFWPNGADLAPDGDWFAGCFTGG